MNLAGTGTIVCGKRGAGKSTIVKKLIAGLPDDRLKIYDVNNEYYESGYILPEMKAFISDAIISRNTCFVFEEATIFFNTRGSNLALTNFLTRLRHTHNSAIFVFHSIRRIPFYVYELCNYVFLLPTKDGRNIVETKFKGELMLEAFDDLNAGKGEELKLFNGQKTKFQFFEP